MARVDAHNWAVGSRGFNEVFSNKLLVMVDGRSVYTPLYSGVYWQFHDLVLEDLDRIEVVRGPGATVWGANAVNGVINITTKPADQTQGLLLSTGTGNYETGLFTARYGGRISSTASYRVYGKYSNRESFELADGSHAHDSWRHGQMGFRIDWTPSDESTLTLQSDGFYESIDQIFDHATLSPPLYRTRIGDCSEVVGGNVVGRWTRATGDDGELQVQAYHDRFLQDASYFDYDIQIFDLDAQHRFALGSWNEVVWGAGYRWIVDEMDGGFNLSLDPAQRTVDLGNLFVQDELKIVEDRLSLFLGSKVEHNDFTGFEIQPGARISWVPAEHHTVWGSVARAVRTPSRAEADVVARGLTLPPAGPGLPPTVIAASGSDAFESEDLLAYELGYRVRPVESVSIDLAAFYNDYRDLRTLERGAPDLSTLPAFITMPLRAGNLLDGRTSGVEA